MAVNETISGLSMKPRRPVCHRWHILWYNRNIGMKFTNEALSKRREPLSAIQITERLLSVALGLYMVILAHRYVIVVLTKC